jgi:hypothetical protein
MSVDSGEQDDIQMGNELDLEVHRISINRKVGELNLSAKRRSRNCTTAIRCKGQQARVP